MHAHNIQNYTFRKAIYFLNKIKHSKNQFSQSQIERSYTGSSNNMKSGYNTNNNQIFQIFSNDSINRKDNRM